MRLSGTSALLLALALGSSGCGGRAPEETPRTIPVRRGVVEVTVSAAGPIQPLRAVEVKSRASGQVLAIPHDAGQPVTVGTTLAIIDPRDERERFRLTEADLLSAKARLSQAEARYALDRDKLVAELQRAEATAARSDAELARARSDFQRQRELNAKGLASRQTLESATSQRATAEAAHDQARAELELAHFRGREVELLKDEVTLAQAGVQRAEVAFEEARQRLDDTVIRSPIEGIILERKVEPGQIIASGISNVGGGTTLLTLADTSRLLVRAQVDESDVGQLVPGQGAAVAVDSYPARTFRGEVNWISPLGKEEQDVTSFEVLVEIFPEGFQGLRVGMTATCQFLAGHVEDALWVPPPALRQRRGQYHLDVVMAPGEASHRLPVTPGLRGPDRIEVRGEGLREGLEVLLSPDAEAGAEEEGGGERHSDPLWFLKKKKPGQKAE